MIGLIVLKRGRKCLLFAAWQCPMTYLSAPAAVGIGTARLSCLPQCVRKRRVVVSSDRWNFGLYTGLTLSLAYVSLVSYL